MKSFRELFEKKLQDSDFKRVYEQECHICSRTADIFSRLQSQSAGLREIAEALDVPVEALRQLADAEFCRPELVVRLCRHLNLPPPENCPRMP